MSAVGRDPLAARAVGVTITVAISARERERSQPMTEFRDSVTVPGGYAALLEGIFSVKGDAILAWLAARRTRLEVLWALAQVVKGVADLDDPREVTWFVIVAAAYGDPHLDLEKHL